MARRREEVRARILLKQKKRDEASDSSVLAKTEIAADTPNEQQEVNPVEEKPKHSLIAFARIFSGVIRKGQRLFVLGPKHKPSIALEQVLFPSIDFFHRICILAI